MGEEASGGFSSFGGTFGDAERNGRLAEPGALFQLVDGVGFRVRNPLVSLLQQFYPSLFGAAVDRSRAFRVIAGQRGASKGIQHPVPF